MSSMTVCYSNGVYIIHYYLLSYVSDIMDMFEELSFFNTRRIHMNTILKTDVLMTGIQIVYLVFLMTEYSSSSVSVSWELENDIIEIGKQIILKCTVNGIKTLDPMVNRQWSVGRDGDLISNNGRSNNPSKYEEVAMENIFSLKINEVTEEDLDLIYECRYGFHIYKKVLEVKNDTVIYPPTEKRTDVSYHVDDSGVTVNIHLIRVFPLPNCSLEYLNTTFLEFNVITYTKQEAFLSVKIPSGKQIIVDDNGYNIVCYISKFKYNMTKPEHLIIYRDHFNSTIIVSLVLFCCMVLLTIMCAFKIRKRRKRKRCRHQQDKCTKEREIVEEQELKELCLSES